MQPAMEVTLPLEIGESKAFWCFRSISSSSLAKNRTSSTPDTMDNAPPTSFAPENEYINILQKN